MPKNMEKRSNGGASSQGCLKWRRSHSSPSGAMTGSILTIWACGATSVPESVWAAGSDASGKVTRSHTKVPSTTSADPRRVLARTEPIGDFGDSLSPPRGEVGVRRGYTGGPACSALVYALEVIENEPHFLFGETGRSGSTPRLQGPSGGVYG